MQPTQVHNTESHQHLHHFDHTLDPHQINKVTMPSINYQTVTTKTHQNAQVYPVMFSNLPSMNKNNIKINQAESQYIPVQVSPQKPMKPIPIL